MDTLENLCRKKLGIDEKVSASEILEYSWKNNGDDIRTFPLVNFRDKRVYSMNAMKNGLTLTILFYKKVKGYFGDYYHVYCKRSDNEYIISRSNKKLNLKLNFFCEYDQKIEDCDLFIPRKTMRFTPISDEYIEDLGIHYKDIVHF